MINTIYKTRIAPLVALSATISLVAGCGGSSSSSDDGDLIVSRGVITGFGSVYVNGHKFETDDARFEIDDDAGSESDLRLGMVVTVIGSRDDDGDYAHQIIYDNELKGPVTDIQIVDGSRKTLTILGQPVLVSLETKIDDDGGLTYGAIALGDVLEVSGYVSNSQLIATHIELQDNDDEIEIRGMIEKLATDSFEIKGFPVSYGPSTEIDDDVDALVEGLYVEVEGQLDVAGTTLIAKQIEAEDDGLDDDANEVEIEGLISGYDPDQKTFMLQGQFVDASTARLEPSSLLLADDLFVEAEGYIADGVLYADEVELEDHDRDDD